MVRKSKANGFEVRKSTEISQRLQNMEARNRSLDEGNRFGQGKARDCSMLTLEGKAKEVGLELGEDLSGEDGLGHLLRKLDTLFLKTTNKSDYEAYKNFDTIKRKANANMADYIVDFDSLYTKIRKREMVRFYLKLSLPLNC